MPEQQSNRTETEDVTRVDSVLGLLSNLSKRDPSPALRERLALIASERLTHRPEDVIRHKEPKSTVWLKPSLASTIVVAVGLATALAFHFRQQKSGPIDRTALVNRPVSSRQNVVQVAPASNPSIVQKPRVRRLRAAPAKSATPEQMTIRLPYSNSAIETGTDTTIRVSMSQSELVSLGFPISAYVQDRRIIAELTLGDDGLPRAITLPLPLKVMKERK